jgi:hypothetical protein
MTLKSAISLTDGSKIYSSLLEWTKKSNPVNNPDFQQKAYEEIKKLRIPVPSSKL